ncbi:hypothetical protein ABEY43_05115 [Priestia megaterium]|uniref:hypothetical protein n=1 Tax=Priestia megaterium TaxID=1404 RepID=UPI002E1B9C5D|nr:hypothetical protein [Priestia megaterium]
MFQETLRENVGSFVQIITAIDVINGTLLAVTDAAAVVRTSSSYGDPADVTISLVSITYVRIFSGVE